jgi:hypothetical protein
LAVGLLLLTLGKMGGCVRAHVTGLDTARLLSHLPGHS